MYSTKKIAITLNGIGQEMLGAEAPQMSKSGPYSEVKSGTNGDKHNLARHDVYDILTLVLKYNSPNIATLESLAQNHVEFPASYKDGNTGKVYNTVKGSCAEIGDHKGDEDRTFTIHFL
jgi:hypothetical protein